MAAINEMGLRAVKQFISRAVVFSPEVCMVGARARTEPARQCIAEKLPRILLTL